MKHRNSFRKASHEWPASPAAYPLNPSRRKGETYCPEPRMSAAAAFVACLVEYIVLPILVLGSAGLFIFCMVLLYRSLQP